MSGNEQDRPRAATSPNKDIALFERVQARTSGPMSAGEDYDKSISAYITAYDIAYEHPKVDNEKYCELSFRSHFHAHTMIQQIHEEIHILSTGCRAKRDYMAM